MKVAAIFPVGASVGGAPDAIRQILKMESELDVYLLPGKQGASNTADPQLFVDQIRSSIFPPGINWIECEAVDPFNLYQTYNQVRDLVGQIAGRDYVRVYVGVTGGTNPMTVSLFQTAIAYLRMEVVPLYVQAHGEVWQANFVASEIRDRITAEEALATARSGQIRAAALLAQHLPLLGPWKFLRESLTALSQWDDFDYSQARQNLEHQARRCGEYASNDLLGPVAETVARIAPNARRMGEFTKQLRDTKNFDAHAISPGWAEEVKENGMLLVADALANAHRRIDEHRYTDSVLRSYRAAECATQMRLLRLGIHPSRPNACSSAYQRYCSHLPMDKNLAFRSGLEFLHSAGELDFSTVDKAFVALADMRNHTYLEHGYRRVSPDQSQRCFHWSLHICQALLGPTIEEKWHEFEMHL